MALSDPNSSMGFEDFDRYQNGEMSYEEQHKFEKRMLEDPMAAAAYEGFLSMNTKKSESQRVSLELSDALKQKIRKKEAKVIPGWFYAAAASVMVSIGAYWLVFLSDQKNQGSQAESSAMVAEPPKFEPIQKPSSEIQPKPAPSKSEHSTAKTTVVSPVPLANIDVLNAAKDEPTKLDDAIAADEKEERLAATESAPAQAPAFADPPSTEILAQKVAKSRPSTVNSDFVSSEGAASAKFSAADSLPAPIIGWPAYNSYLYKSAISSSDNEEITVFFTINADASLTDFHAKGNQKNLLDLAIRIVKEGPSWKSASSNGSVKASSMKVKLRFHPN